MKPARARTLADLGERAWLRQVRRWMAADGRRLPLGIGDDGAVLATGGARRIVVTTDALVEGVHFRRDWTTPGDLGRKALAVNLSDLAAMGVRPLAVFLTLSIPASTPLKELGAFFLGLRAEGRAWDCPLAGGDLTRGPHWSLAVTVLGRPSANTKGRAAKVFRRDTAHSGDWLYITGWPGRSGAAREALEQDCGRRPTASPPKPGQRSARGSLAFNSALRTPHSALARIPPVLLRAHRRPVPRLREAEHLARLGCVRAALDVSDGLWDDAGKLAEASGVRLDLWRDALPVAPALRRFAAQRNRDPLDWILFGGEDYELLFTTRRRLDPARDWPRDKTLAPLHLIGRVESAGGSGARGLRLLDANGRPVLLRDRTWSHF
jgi:thiamine-monophosphate kinase